MPTIPFVQSQRIKQFPAAEVFGDNRGTLNKNVMVEQNGDTGEYELTQRPAIWHQTNGSAQSKDKGRCLYQPAAVIGARLYVNGTTIYKTSGYSTEITNSLQTNPVGAFDRLPVFFEYLDNDVIVVDPGTSTGKPFYLISSPYTTLSQQTDTDIPDSVVAGVAQLDKYIFVLDAEGLIYNCDNGDPTSWSATNFIGADRTQGDFALRIERHKDNLAVWKDNSIEFFYNAGNPTGSPLKRRQDVFYEVGGYRSTAIGDYSQTVIKDAIFFVGVDAKSKLPGVYVLENFNLRKISDHFLDSILRKWQPNRYIIGSTLEYFGRSFYVLTATNVSAVAEESLVIDTDTGYVAQWDTNLTGIGENILSVMPGAIYGVSTNQDIGLATNYMLGNGDIIGIGNNWFGSDVATTDALVDIDIEIRTDVNDFGTVRRKFCRSLGLLGHDYKTGSYQQMSISHSDDNQTNFSTPRFIQIDPGGFKKITACGSFYGRSWKTSGSLNSRVWLRGLEANIE